eukprot:514107_1
MNGYIINPPINNRLQRSKSQRLQGRRSVHLNDTKKSTRDFYEEWKQKHANDNLFLNSMSYNTNNNNYPYPMNTNTSITPTHSIPHSPLIQTQRQPHTHAQQYQLNNNTQYYVVRNPAQHTHARIHPHVQQPQYVTYNMEYYDNFDINDINNLDNISDIIPNIKDISPIPINNEIKNTSTLPLNITPLKKKINNKKINVNNTTSPRGCNVKSP